ncbi:hypothetical protein C8Q72DRAFT_890411 [Fomitopsis betulina]|nr:hypothetical protein C8Q72DRAFT_890411 [Fomitopsis betulina]
MTKGPSMPYPRPQIEQLLQAEEEEDEENQTVDNASKYRGQSTIFGPKAERGRQVFADILNESDPREREFFPASTNIRTAAAHNQRDHDEYESPRGSPSPIYPLPQLLVLPAVVTLAGGTGVPEDPVHRIQGNIDRLGLSTEDASLVATYYPLEPETCPPLEQSAPRWAYKAGGRQCADDHGVFPFYPTVKPQADGADPELLDPIVPIDLDLVFSTVMSSFNPYTQQGPRKPRGTTAEDLLNSIKDGSWTTMSRVPQYVAAPVPSKGRASYADIIDIEWELWRGGGRLDEDSPYTTWPPPSSLILGPSAFKSDEGEGATGPGCGLGLNLFGVDHEESGIIGHYGAEYGVENGIESVQCECDTCVAAEWLQDEAEKAEVARLLDELIDMQRQRRAQEKSVGTRAAGSRTPMLDGIANFETIPKMSTGDVGRRAMAYGDLLTG